MLGIVSEDENHNKTFKPMAGATLGQGVPLGAWCSFEKDVAPSNNWLMAGTTFDATVYPALNLYLGTNKVPSRYDHSRLTDPELITLSTDGNNPTVMDYDGFINVWTKADSGLTFKINGVTMPYFAYATTASSQAGNPTMFAFSKGDTISYTGAGTFYVRYYTHPLFIKATSIASDSDKDSILAQIQEYNTYSTEETLTGKTWIDGKPIYRKCYYSATGYANQQVIGTISNLGSVTNIICNVTNNLNKCVYPSYTGSLDGYFIVNSTNGDVIARFTSDFLGSNPQSCIIEYTKTND